MMNPDVHSSMMAGFSFLWTLILLLACLLLLATLVMLLIRWQYGQQRHSHETKVPPVAIPPYEQGYQPQSYETTPKTEWSYRDYNEPTVQVEHTYTSQHETEQPLAQYPREMHLQ